MFIKTLCNRILRKIQDRSGKRKIIKQTRNNVNDQKSKEQTILGQNEINKSRNMSKIISTDFTIYEDLTHDEFCSDFDKEPVDLNDDTIKSLRRNSCSNFDAFLEEIDKEEEGIFAGVEFVNSPDVLESSLDDVYELFEVNLYENLNE